MNHIEITADEAASIWAGDTASLSNLQVPEENPEVKEEIKEENKEETIINEEEINNLFIEKTSDDEEEIVITQEDGTKTTTKTGRKSTDLVMTVNQMIEDGSLKAFEDSEIKTIEDARELIKLNLESVKSEGHEEAWEAKIKTYSPQVQAILQYAEAGGKDLTPLISAISNIEKTVNYDIETEDGQEAIVRDTLREKGFDEEEIEDQITTLKELDKLKLKAEKFFPELENTRTLKAQRMLKDQEDRQNQAREASEKYIQTITSTLNKEIVGGLKLKKEDKAKIFQSLANANHISLNGAPTNGFVKALENMQFGENADYDHFLNVVHLAVDKESFMEKLRLELKNEVSAETARKLKESRNTTPNATQEFSTDTPVNKKTITRSKFKNPFE